MQGIAGIYLGDLLLPDQYEADLFIQHIGSDCLWTCLPSVPVTLNH
jgi:hypothetical protein